MTSTMDVHEYIHSDIRDFFTTSENRKGHLGGTVS